MYYINSLTQERNTSYEHFIKDHIIHVLLRTIAHVKLSMFLLLALLRLRKDQELIQLSTTPDPGYQLESDKLTVIHLKREPRGQPFFQQVATRQINRRAQRHNRHKTEENMKDPQEKYRLGTLSKIFYSRA